MKKSFHRINRPKPVQPPQANKPPAIVTREDEDDSGGRISPSMSAFADNSQLALWLCSRMQQALEGRDEPRAYAYMEAARCVAVAALDGSTHVRTIVTASTFIEADMQMGLWTTALEDGRRFTAGIARAFQETKARN